MLPYPHYIAKQLPPNFLMPPTDSEPVPAVEPMPLPEPELELESTVEIEWDNPSEPIGFLCSIRSISEQPEVRAALPSTLICPTASPQQLVATRPALTLVTEQHPAPMSLNEHHPAPTDGTNRAKHLLSPVRRAPIEPMLTVRLRLTPFCPPE